MSTQLLDIQPRELKFMFELKKQSSCAVQLINISDQIVAFKVKTTSPKKYCVRPTTGIIKPKSKCDFTVTMQAQRSAPSDMQCKDKFLIQSTAVPFGTTEEEITPGMFAKDSGKHIEESKLRVVLISPPNSPVLLAVNGVTKQEPSYDTSVQKDKQSSGVKNLPPPVLAKDIEDVKSAPVMEELMCGQDVELRPANEAELIPSKDVEQRPVKDMEEKNLKLGKEMEELKSKLNILETKLSEAEVTIGRLTKETSTNTKEKEKLKQELALVRRKNGARKVQIGFPLLFVCAVMLISLAVGYLLHP